MNVGSKRPIVWNNSRHAHSWRLYLHCGIEETGSCGIICIVYHLVLRHPSEHGTSSMGKQLLAKAHMATLNKLTEWVVTELTSFKVDETALPILKRQGHRGIAIVSSQRKIIFDFPVKPYWPKWQTKRSKPADEDFETSEFHQETWNRYLIIQFLSADIAWNIISNPKLRRSCEVLRDDLVRPSAMPLTNICRWVYALTVNAIYKQFPAKNTFCLALDRLTWTIKQAITAVIDYHRV